MSNKPKIEVEDPKRTVAEASAQLGVEEKTMRNWMAKGQLPYLKILGGAVRIRQSVLDEILTDANMDYLEKKGVRSQKGRKVAAA